jgi:hypothetical protein
MNTKEKPAPGGYRDTGNGDAFDTANDTPFASANQQLAFCSSLGGPGAMPGFLIAHPAKQLPEEQPVEQAFAVGLTESCRTGVTAARMSWSALRNLFSFAHIGDKDGTGIVPAQIETGPRKAERVQSVSLLMLDIETKREVPPTVDEISEQLAGMQAMLYTTYGHIEETPRYRLVIAPARPLSPHEVRPVGLAVAGKLGLSDSIDTACLEPSRMFYLPRVPAALKGQFRFAEFEGALLDVDALLETIPPETSGAPSNAAARGEWTIDDYADMLAVLDPSCGRRDWLNYGMAGHVEFGGSEQAFSAWSDWSETSAEKFPGDRKIRQQWNSFKQKDGGITFGTVLKAALEAGWRRPEADVEEMFSAMSSESVPQLGWKFVPLTAPGDHHEEMPHAVELLVPLNEVTLLSGHGGGGKSYIALLMALNVVLGRHFGVLPTTQRSVLFFSAEDGARVLRSRLTKLCKAYEINPSELAGKLHIIDASDIDAALYRDQRGGRFETTLLDKLAALVEMLNIGLTVIDNASDVFDAEEIKRTHVRGFIRALRSRIARPDRAVLLLAHINKASASGAATGREDYSGSTAWHNSVRSRLSLLPVGADSIKIEHQKANLGRKADPMHFAWVDGVPMVHDQFPGKENAEAESARRTADMDSVVAIIEDFDQRGERVTTAFQGSWTVYKLLKPHPLYPAHLGSDDLRRAFWKLEADGRIFRRTVKTSDRKSREVFTCVA